jgi:hypothetical protein
MQQTYIIYSIHIIGVVRSEYLKMMLCTRYTWEDLLRVCCCVFGQIWFYREWFHKYVTHVGFVCSDMTRKITLLGKYLHTHLTCVRFVTSMCSSMLNKMWFRRERFHTHVTCVRVVNCVMFSMNVQIWLGSERLSTYVTLVVGFVPSVSKHMIS